MVHLIVQCNSTVHELQLSYGVSHHKPNIQMSPLSIKIWAILN